MAKRKTDVLVEAMGHYVRVWTDHNVELAERARLIPGVSRAYWLVDRANISIDERYDAEEVTEEIEVLIKKLGQPVKTKGCPTCGGRGEVEAE